MKDNRIIAHIARTQCITHTSSYDNRHQTHGTGEWRGRRGRQRHAKGYVAECGLPGAACATTMDTRHTSNSTSSTPALSTVLHAGLRANGVRLAVVLAHVRVDELNNICANGRKEHRRQVKRACCRGSRPCSGAEDRNLGASSGLWWREEGVHQCHKHELNSFSLTRRIHTPLSTLVWKHESN